MLHHKSIILKLFESNVLLAIVVGIVLAIGAFGTFFEGNQSSPAPKMIVEITTLPSSPSHHIEPPPY